MQNVALSRQLNKCKPFSSNTNHFFTTLRDNLFMTTSNVLNSVTAKRFAENFPADYVGRVGRIQGMVKRSHERASKKYKGKMELINEGLFKVFIGDHEPAKTTVSMLPRHINNQMEVGAMFDFNINRIKSKDHTESEPKYLLIIDNTPTDDEWDIFD